jgi:inner membrane protein
MKWTTHKLLTGSLIYALTGNPLTAIVAASGSILPDSIEGFPNDSNRAAWQRRHRKRSHFFPFYLLPALFLYSYSTAHNFLPITVSNLSDYISHIVSNLNLQTCLPIFTYYLSILLFGALLHILEDALCGKVPLFNPNRQSIGIKLFYVGSSKEYVLVTLTSLFLILLRFKLDHIPFI